MPLSRTVATVTWESLSPYSQSRAHEEPELEGESKGDYDKRIWRAHLFVNDGVVCLPSAGIHQCLVSAAKYTKKKIVGQGNATWTAKFTAGIALFSSPSLGVSPDAVQYVDIYCNADGVRGSGKRVMRRYPELPSWKSTFDIHILDPIITQDIFEEMVENAGLFVGLGRWRPEKGGLNGRFNMTGCIWTAERAEKVRKAA